MLELSGEIRGKWQILFRRGRDPLDSFVYFDSSSVARVNLKPSEVDRDANFILAPVARRFTY